MSFNPETLFGYIHKKEWELFSNYLLRHEKDILSSPVALAAKQVFELEFMVDVEASGDEEKLRLLKDPSLLIIQNNYKFSEGLKERIVDQKLQAHHRLGQEDLAFGYAQENKSRPLAKKIINEFMQVKPEVAVNAARNDLKIKSNGGSLASVTKTISLFRSPQETLFYLAAKECFPEYLHYPNVGISSTIDYDAIKDLLTPQERTFFFKGVLDFVVFDIIDYRPRHFFELDSQYHDGEKQKENDRLKDSILRKAGIKLLRIRAYEETARNIDTFKIVISNLIGTGN